MIITCLMTDSVEPRYVMVTRMMIKHRTQLLSTTKGDLRLRLANLKSKFAKLKCFFSASDDFISLTFSLLLLKITFLIIRVWITNGTQTANGIFQTSNNSTYISLPKTSARWIIPVKRGAFLGTFRFVGLYKKVLYTTV